MPLRPIRFRFLVAALLAVAALAAAGGAGTYAALAPDSSKTIVRQVTVSGSQPAAVRTLSVNQIYERARRGVVRITVSSTSSVSSPFGQSQTQQAQGSGFVYDDKGDILTNEHVVDGAASISVKFWNGATYKAKLVGRDASTDLAVIRVDAPTSLLHPLALGDSSSLAVGDGVVAIGSPFGLDSTVTSGIVSALHRQMTSPNNFTINDTIQTDAAINHGNSGGPLLNGQGRVIGVNTQIESESGGSDGVGFAVPSSAVRSVVSQLLTSGKVRHPYLGVAVQTIPAAAAKALHVPTGAEIAEIRSGTPAARAGLRSATGSRTVAGERYPTGGDVITKINGRRVTSATALQRAIGAKNPGDTISLTYFRSGATHTARITLATRPS